MGMVISTMPIGDYDKRVLILTKDYGKISAFAKGARRPNSALLACTQPFTFGNFTLIQGRNSNNLIHAEISNYFTELRTDFDAVTYGMYFCEFADFYGRENVEAKEMLRLMYQSLRALSVKSIPHVLIRYIFELRMIAINGEGPQVFRCVKCNHEIESDKSYLFHTREGGLFCENCKPDFMGGFYISPATIYTMQFILCTPIEKLYTFLVSEEVSAQLGKVMNQYVDTYVDKKFQSLKMLEL